MGETIDGNQWLGQWNGMRVSGRIVRDDEGTIKDIRLFEVCSPSGEITLNKYLTKEALAEIKKEFMS